MPSADHTIVRPRKIAFHHHRAYYAGVVVVCTPPLAATCPCIILNMGVGVPQSILVVALALACVWRFSEFGCETWSRGRRLRAGGPSSHQQQRRPAIRSRNARVGRAWHTEIMVYAGRDDLTWDGGVQYDILLYCTPHYYYYYQHM